ncbi:MAG: cytochrome c biogenesis protein ResB [FCB group bacterium]|jgi:hypothetical protein|nr:cytochrome c biogenesis protein ResB [FCB group bacterium]
METPAKNEAASDIQAGTPPAEAGDPHPVLSLPVKAFRWMASYHFSCLLLFFLFVLTLLGTLYQVNNGVYAAQEKYFESVVVVQEFGVIPLPLPGGRLLLTLLFFNLLCGAILRARKGWSRIGILTAHLGILMLLAGSFITYRYAQGGQMVLYEGQQSGYFESRDEWELAVTPLGDAGTARQSVVALPEFKDNHSDSSLLVSNDALPFELDVSGFLPNATPQPKAADTPPKARMVDGYFLKPEEPSTDPGRDLPGLIVAVRDGEGNAFQEGIVWAGQKAPWAVETRDGSWSFKLQRRRWPLPFTLVLNTFSRELHPRTAMAKAYASEVTRIDGGTRQAVRISMNEPLRSNGYTLYQASWGPQDAAPGTPLYSVLAVSRDPAERFPLYACIIVTCGLVLHFTIRLLGYLRQAGVRKS